MSSHEISTSCSVLYCDDRSVRKWKIHRYPTTCAHPHKYPTADPPTNGTPQQRSTVVRVAVGLINIQRTPIPLFTWPLTHTRTYINTRPTPNQGTHLHVEAHLLQLTAEALLVEDELVVLVLLCRLVDKCRAPCGGVRVRDGGATRQGCGGGRTMPTTQRPINVPTRALLALVEVLLVELLVPLLLVLLLQLALLEGCWFDVRAFD